MIASINKVWGGTCCEDNGGYECKNVIHLMPY
jgi:hypothetical protein